MNSHSTPKDRSCRNRLTVVGSSTDLQKFHRDDHWMTHSGGRHFELLEYSASRHSWQFDSDAPPLEVIRELSRKSPITFLLEYDWEDQRLKGLAKARNGRLRHFRLRY